MNFIDILTRLTKKQNVKFLFEGSEINLDQIFSQQGLLPAIVKIADRFAVIALGYGLGASFSDAENSPLGIQVQFDESTPNFLRVLFLYDVILNLIHHSEDPAVVSLDELIYE